MAKAAAMDRKELLFIRTSSVEQPPCTATRTPRKRLNYSTDAKAKSTPRPLIFRINTIFHNPLDLVKQLIPELLQIVVVPNFLVRGSYSNHRAMTASFIII